MCGIIGYVGEKNCTPILLNGLKNLEYRGYDSAGIAVLEGNSINIKKSKGRVKNLEDLIEKDLCGGNIGIAHTRWATHGKPSKENAHPHEDNSHTFALVHNGIIENYKELRHFLCEQGYSFFSETDTEVIPNLIHYYYEKQEKTKDGFLQAVALACKKLEGSFAILVLCKYFPQTIILARRNSPLVVGKGKNEYYIASDIPAILEYTRDFYFLDDNEISFLESDIIHFFDFDLLEHEKELIHSSLSRNSSNKNGYEDFMLKEIEEQPQAIFDTLNQDIDLHLSSSFSQIYIVACGTAMHAGLVGKTCIETLCKIPTFVEVASEFRYRNPIIDSHTLCIFISQSGETADTIAALKLAKQKKAKTIAISNVMGSSISREADVCFYTYAGPEIAVASTKAYTSQVCLLCMLAILFAKQLKTASDKDLEVLKEDLLQLPKQIENILEHKDKIQILAKQLAFERDMFFLGRGIDYTTCLEASLKLKEISYIHSEAYPAGELKHGPIALIEQNTPVVGILTEEALLEKTISNLQEVIARGAKTFIVTNQELPKNIFDFVFTIPKTSRFTSPALSIVPLQLFSYYIAKQKNLDVDKPRNLAKSVTVE